MFTAALITLREGLEAALIVGIMLGLLRNLGQAHRRRELWSGVIAAIAASIAVGLLLYRLGISFEGRGEKIFEGLAMLVAAVAITSVIIWMARQGRNTQTNLERDTTEAIGREHKGLLFGVAFVAVIREGIETVLFLIASGYSSTPAQTLVGGALGLAGAVAMGWFIYARGRTLNLRAFFRWTGWLLILVAAGLLAQAVHEFQEAAILPVLVEHVWNLNGLIDENGVFGSLLKALVGYNGNPSLLEVITYASYWIALAMFHWPRWQRSQQSAAAASSI